MREDIATAGLVGFAEFQDEGPYEVDCPKGHRSFVLLQEQRFEILFMIGCYAVLDGYYREAVSSFSSSLERLYEYFIRAALVERGISDDRIEQSWKAVARQSERQLGGFIALYLREIGEAPATLSSSEVNFRNDVIHRGNIPTRTATINYGDRILTLGRSILATTKDHFPKGAQTLMIRHLQTSAEKAGTTARATISIPTVLNIATMGGKVLEQELVDLAKYRKSVHPTQSS